MTGLRINDVMVNVSFGIPEISLITAGSDDRAVLHGQNSEKASFVAVIESYAPFAPVRFSSDRLYIPAQIHNRACDAVLPKDLSNRLGSISLCDTAEIYLHAFRQRNLPGLLIKLNLRAIDLLKHFLNIRIQRSFTGLLRSRLALFAAPGSSFLRFLLHFLLRFFDRLLKAGVKKVRESPEFHERIDRHIERPVRLLI